MDIHQIAPQVVPRNMHLQLTVQHCVGRTVYMKQQFQSGMTVLVVPIPGDIYENQSIHIDIHQRLKRGCTETINISHIFHILSPATKLCI